MLSSPTLTPILYAGWQYCRSETHSIADLILYLYMTNVLLSLGGYAVTSMRMTTPYSLSLTHLRGGSDAIGQVKLESVRVVLSALC